MQICTVLYSKVLEEILLVNDLCFPRIWIEMERGSKFIRYCVQTPDWEAACIYCMILCTTLVSRDSLFRNKYFFLSAQGNYCKECIITLAVSSLLQWHICFPQLCSALMDCVGCEKCRLWGKLQVLGLGTALKILFSGVGQENLAERVILLTQNWHQNLSYPLLLSTKQF